MDGFDKAVYALIIWCAVFFCVLIITSHNAQIYSETNGDIKIQYTKELIGLTEEEKFNLISSLCERTFKNESYESKLWLGNFFNDETSNIRNCKLNLMD